MVATDNRLRGHKYKFEKERSNIDIRKYFFSQRVVNYWNMLPLDVVGKTGQALLLIK